MAAYQQENQGARTNFEIEVVDEEGWKVKIHYSGYSEEYDEWKFKSEIQYIKPRFDQDDDDFSPLTELARAIKRKLLPFVREIRRYGFRCLVT